MDVYTFLPDKTISPAGEISQAFLELGITRFQDACQYVHALPYGYNSDRDDIMILFAEKMGSCTTKHAVIAALAQELALPVGKTIGIYGMTEAIVTGTDAILERFGLPYIPMVHCFLEAGTYRVDLTEGNRNGKNCSIEEFFYVQNVIPNIAAKDEYLLYRQALKDVIMARKEFQGIDLKRVLQAREEGIALLRAHITT